MIPRGSSRILICTLCVLNVYFFLTYFTKPPVRRVRNDNEEEFREIANKIVKRESGGGKVQNVGQGGLFDNERLLQDDPEMIAYIRQHHLTPPSNEPYNLENPKGNPSSFVRELKLLFGSKRNGVFIECGANDGEYLSNTLALERDYGWTGILIEADHLMLPKLYGKHRKAWISDTCVSFKPYPKKVRFIHDTATDEPWAKAIGIIEPSGLGNPKTVQFKERSKNYVYTGDSECFPLFSILTAVNMTTIDFFTLDVEGLEYKILKTIPFDFVTIKVISVEFHLIPEGKGALVHFMTKKGYRLVMQSDREYFFILKRFSHEFQQIWSKLKTLNSIIVA